MLQWKDYWINIPENAIVEIPSIIEALFAVIIEKQFLHLHRAEACSSVEATDVALLVLLTELTGLNLVLSNQCSIRQT